MTVALYCLAAFTGLILATLLHVIDPELTRIATALERIATALEKKDDQ